jgi:hypothetical protein
VYKQGEDGWVISSIPRSQASSARAARDEARKNVIDTLRLMLSPEPPEPPDADDQRERLHLTIAA